MRLNRLFDLASGLYARILKKREMTKKLFTLSLWVLTVLFSSAQGIPDEERQWLIDNIKKNFVFVEGGTCWQLTISNVQLTIGPPLSGWLYM